MKKTLLLAFTALTTATFYAQAPEIQWQKCFGGTDSDYAACVKQTAEGGYITAGYTRSVDGDITANHGQDDILVVKLNASGTAEWKKTFGGSSTEQPSGIQQTTDGGYIISGMTYSVNGDITSNHGNRDFWVLKLSADGTLEWQKTYGGNNNENSNTIAKTADGGYIIAGSSASSNGDVTNGHGSDDAWIVKLNSAGTIQWQKTYGGTGTDSATSVTQTADGSYIFCGTTNSTNGDVSGLHGTLDYWVVKLNTAGTITWQKTFGGSNADEAKSVIQTSDGGYIVAGSTGSSDGNVTGFHTGTASDEWLVKISATGTIEWQKTYGGTLEDVAYAVRQLPDNGYVVLGYTQSQDWDVDFNHAMTVPTLDIWMVRLDASGVIQWQKSLGNYGYDDSKDFDLTNDGGFIVAGNSSLNGGDVSGYHGGNTDLWIVKLAADPLATQSFSDKGVSVYPNPVESTLNIQVPNTTTANIAIYDSRGVMVKSYLSDEKSIDVSDLASGTYILKYTDPENGTLVQKFVKK
ncbi:MAG TPA: T9SS type A sorting domain-containing protein [Flavobacterium sp.]|nr:T9SS type A sorting domain-containing protein [Flavobacterium sp.]